MRSVMYQVNWLEHLTLFAREGRTHSRREAYRKPFQSIHLFTLRLPSKVSEKAKED